MEKTCLADKLFLICYDFGINNAQWNEPLMNLMILIIRTDYLSHRRYLTWKKNEEKFEFDSLDTERSRASVESEILLARHQSAPTKLMTTLDRAQPRTPQIPWRNRLHTRELSILRSPLDYENDGETNISDIQIISDPRDQESIWRYDNDVVLYPCLNRPIYMDHTSRKKRVLLNVSRRCQEFVFIFFTVLFVLLAIAFGLSLAFAINYHNRLESAMILCGERCDNL
ncbi:hypothetical protein V1511DRAFT_267302 [Dipodascopsis uninucleata]